MNSRQRRKLSRQQAKNDDKKKNLSSKTGGFGTPCDDDKMPNFVIAPLPDEPPAPAAQPLQNFVDNDLRRRESPPTVAPDEVSNGANSEILETHDSRRQESPSTGQESEKRGRPPVFDQTMKNQVIGLITAGVSQRAAAAYHGIDQSTISKAIERDEDFAREVEKARAASRIKPFLCIVKASRKDYKAAFRLLQHLRGDEHLREYDPPTAEEQAEMRAQAARDCEEETFAIFDRSRRMFERLDEEQKQRAQAKVAESEAAVLAGIDGRDDVSAQSEAR